MQRCLCDGNVAVALSGVDSVSAQLLLDAQQLVVLGQALGAAGGAGLDLAGGQAHRQISDEAVLGLAGPAGRRGVSEGKQGGEARGGNKKVSQ